MSCTHTALSVATLDQSRLGGRFLVSVTAAHVLGISSYLVPAPHVQI